MERVTGIEPVLFAWEAKVLPLNYTRSEPSGEDAIVPRVGIIASPPRVCDYTDPSHEESPDGSQHAFASGRSFHPLSPPLQRSLRFFHPPLPALVKRPLRNVLFSNTYAITCPARLTTGWSVMDCHVFKERLDRLTTFRTSNRIETVPPFHR